MFFFKKKIDKTLLKWIVNVIPFNIPLSNSAETVLFACAIYDLHVPMPLGSFSTHLDRRKKTLQLWQGGVFGAHIQTTQNKCWSLSPNGLN